MHEYKEIHRRGAVSLFLQKQPFAKVFKIDVRKGALSGLRQFLAAESPLKWWKMLFISPKKALFALKIFKVLSWLFGHVAKRLDKKVKVNFKFYDAIAWLTNNCNTHITQYLENKGKQIMKFGQLIECKMRNIFCKNHTQNMVEKLVPDPFLKN